MAASVPLVDYLDLDGPSLVVNECTSCGARFFDRRNACAACSGLQFDRATLPREGQLTAFTVVSFAAPGVPVPFIAGVVDCGGTSVRTNVINVPADPDHVWTGMSLRLATYALGMDEDGTEAIGFGFEPTVAY